MASQFVREGRSASKRCCYTLTEGRRGDCRPAGRFAAAAQHGIANGFMCLGQSAAADEAMDELVAQFAEVAVEALREESVRHAELLGRPLDVVEAGAVALSTARIFARCAPKRVASVTDPAVAELRAAASAPTHDVLIAQLEQLRADAPAS